MCLIRQFFLFKPQNGWSAKSYHCYIMRLLKNQKHRNLKYFKRIVFLQKYDIIDVSNLVCLSNII